MNIPDELYKELIYALNAIPNRRYDGPRHRDTYALVAELEKEATHTTMPITSSILRLPDVKARCGLGRSSIYNMMAEGQFPQAVSLGQRAVGWVEAEIVQWIQDRIERRKSCSTICSTVPHVEEK